MGFRPKQGDFTGATGMCQEPGPICKPRLDVQRAFRHRAAGSHLVPVLVEERFSRLSVFATSPALPGTTRDLLEQIRQVCARGKCVAKPLGTTSFSPRRRGATHGPGVLAGEFICLCVSPKGHWDDVRLCGKV